MSGKRQFEVLLVRLVPHALRDDFMTVGVAVLENSSKPSAVSHQPSGISNQAERFADVRFTRDWKRVECFAPDLELEIFEYLERAVRERLGEIHGREELVALLEERFGAVFDVAPVKALVAEDPAAEMKALVRDYLDPMRPVERARRLGRLGIVGRMQDALASAGVLEMMMRDLDMTEFTGKDDAFHVDFGYRVGRSVKMLQGLAFGTNRDPALALAYRYTKIQGGMRKKGDEALITAIVSEAAMRAEGEAASGIAMLRTNEIAVRGVEEMGEIAEEIRRELQA